MSVPAIFQLQTRLREPSFRNLSTHNLTADEKRWILEEVEHTENHKFGSLTGEPYDKVDGLRSQSKALVAHRWSLNPVNLRKWLYNKKKHNRLPVVDSWNGGRPPAIDSVAMEVIAETVVNGEFAKSDGRIEPLTQADVFQLIQEGQMSTKKRKLHNPNLTALTVSGQKIDLRTVKKLKIEHNVRDRTPQGLSLARAKSINNPRLILQYATILWGAANKLPPSNTVNGDFTTYICEGDGKHMKVCVVRETYDKQQVTSTKKNDGLNILVKDFSMGNCRGDIYRPAYIVKVRIASPCAIE